MSKISIYIKDSIEEQLKQEAKKNEKSLSEYAGELIELGLKIKSMQQDESRKKEEELMDKTPEYLLRIMNICSEVLRCSYDPNKALQKAETADEALSMIREKAVSYINGFTGKESN